MKKLIIHTAIAIAAFTAHSTLSAKPIEEKNLQNGKQSIQLNKGYIYLHGPQRQIGMFLKVASDQAREAYEKEWLEELVKAQEKYQRRIKTYDDEVERARKARTRMPEKPIEPTRENFAIDPLELRGSENFGPQYVFAKEKGDEKLFTYLNEVEPGTYLYYGPILANPNGGYFGTCFCMGSVQFEVKAGMITNIGNFLGAGPDYASVTTAISDINTVLSARQLTMPQLDYTLPATLAAQKNAIPDFRAAGKIDNHFGVTIDRMPAIPGILAYDRDIVIDVKSQMANKAALVDEQNAPDIMQAEEPEDAGNSDSVIKTTTE